MKTNRKHLYGTCLALVALLPLAGCLHQCPENKEAGIAHISCQPMNARAKLHGEAKFEVKARGRDTTYQWYHRGLPVGNYTEGGQSNVLRVLDVRAETMGDYWCEIDSKDPTWDEPVRTRTRIAYLQTNSASSMPGIGGPAARSILASNIVTLSVPPVSGNPPLPAPNKCCCGKYCTYVVFNNNSAGYKPDANTTKFEAKVHYQQIGQLLDNTKYYLLRKGSALRDTNCAANLPASLKTGPCRPTTNYSFTVYFKDTDCPANNSTIWLEVDWKP